MLLLVGLPCFFLEFSIGQYAGLSATKIYARLAPGLRGLGYGMISIPTIVNFQYVVIMAYALYFLFAGMQTTLPWSHCQHEEFNTDNCYEIQAAADCNETQNYYAKGCMDSSEFCENFGHDLVSYINLL